MEFKLEVVTREEDGGLEALNRYTQTERLWLLIETFQTHMRTICKHGSEEDIATTWDKVKEFWYETKNDAGVYED